MINAVLTARYREVAVWCKQCKVDKPPEKFYPVARG